MIKCNKIENSVFYEQKSKNVLTEIELKSFAGNRVKKRFGARRVKTA